MRVAKFCLLPMVTKNMNLYHRNAASNSQPAKSFGRYGAKEHAESV